MKALSLDDLKLALAECASLSGEIEFVVVGSVAIVGAHPAAPAVLRVSQDIDLFSRSGATLELNRAIYERFGPDSDFAIQHDFYIEPVGDWTVMTSLPGWQERLVKVDAPGGAIGWCLSPLDIAYNKAEAGREKDIAYLAELFRAGFVRPSEIKAAMDAAGTAPETVTLIDARVQEAIRRSMR